ncbi:MAG: type II secretion system secretin GspD [Gammaproteobacteria bacterium]
MPLLLPAESYPAPAAATQTPPDASPSVGKEAGTAPTYFGTNESNRAARNTNGVNAADYGSGTNIQFRDADIRSVVDAILGDALNLNYTVDPAIQGKITLRTSAALTRQALLPALESALLSVSAAIVKQGSVYHVVPLEAAPQKAHGLDRWGFNRSVGPGFGIDIYPLRYISASEMQKLLDTIFPKGTVLQANTTHNYLVIAGTSQDRLSIQQVIENFDVDALQGTRFALFPVEHTAPRELIEELKEIFQPPLDILDNRVRLVALERLQSVLGIAGNLSDLKLMESWIKRLDTAKTTEQRVFVYHVQNGNAKNLAAAIGQLLGIGGTGTDTAGDTGLSDAAATPDAAASDGIGFGQSGYNMTPTSLNAPSVSAQANSPAAAGTTSKLVANEETNSLMYYGDEKSFNMIKDALVQLDIVPKQVLIEAILAEVTLTNELRYGVQWFFQTHRNTFELSSTDAALSSLFPGFSYAFTGSPDIKVILNALQSKTDVRVISAPKLSVLNNQKASLQVGDQVPVLTQTSQSTITPGAPIVSSVQMRDTGVILEIKPRINENGSLILEVSQEVSDVAQTTTSGINSPTIQKRKFQTSVLTHDGYTVTLGGLIRDNNTKNNSGVPLLKDIPLLGNLFRDNSFNDKRTELIVLLVPHIMRNQAETQAVVESLLGQLKASAASIERISVPAQ